MFFPTLNPDDVRGPENYSEGGTPRKSQFGQVTGNAHLIGNPMFLPGPSPFTGMVSAAQMTAALKAGIPQIVPLATERYDGQAPMFLLSRPEKPKPWERGARGGIIF